MTDPAPDNDLTPLIREAAGTSASTSVDGVSESNRSVSEIIEADRYLKSSQALKSPRRGLLISKIVPPGAN